MQEKEMNSDNREWSLSDVAEINDAHLSHVRCLGRTELESRANRLMVDSIEFPTGLMKAKEILAEHGIVIIPNVLARDVCDRAVSAIKGLCDYYLDKRQHEYEDAAALFQVGVGRLKGYGQLSGYGKAVINVREGQDQGMIDIFNCDLALPEELKEARARFASESLMSLLNRKDIKPRNLNVYLNRGVQRTRGFHVDSYTENLKAFIYLSDVEFLDDGPYTYVMGSHRDDAFRRANQRLSEGLPNSTESPLVDQSRIVPVLAPRGSLVISDQAGVHRGWPQHTASQRVAAVMKYS
jgi:hypothetical protein